MVIRTSAQWVFRVLGAIAASALTALGRRVASRQSSDCVGPTIGRIIGIGVVFDNHDRGCRSSLSFGLIPGSHR